MVSAFGELTGEKALKKMYSTMLNDSEGILILRERPVINSKQPELFPSLIDMGVGCIIGKTYSKQLQIESNCPVSFEYTIEVI